LEMRGRNRTKPARSWALAHGDDDRIRGAYNGSYWAERVKMEQWWANHLDMLRNGTYAMKRAAKA
jgi:hypothetical protein